MASTSQDSAQDDRREFFRLKFNEPLQFKSYPSGEGSSSRIASGTTQNISQSGILFQTTQKPPQLSSILWMNLDIRTLKICQEIENRAIVVNKGLLGRVVRVEEEPGNSSVYDVGVCFITHSQETSQEVQQFISAAFPATNK